MVLKTSIIFKALQTRLVKLQQDIEVDRLTRQTLNDPWHQLNGVVQLVQHKDAHHREAEQMLDGLEQLLQELKNTKVMPSMC